MHRKTKLRLADLNPCLSCRLCGGYYVDACTIQECLHSFCKSCIVRYLETKKNCPVCRVLIHKTKPLQNVRPDPTLQDVVYKLVPGILKDEMLRRRRFYAEHPCAGPEGNPSWSEDRGDIIDPERAIFMEDDKISMALIHSLDGKPAPESTSSIVTQQSEDCTSAGIPGQSLGTTYLFCPAMVTIGVLKKLIRLKFNLHPVDDLIDIFQSDESLSEEYTLMDIVYLYTWRRQGPLRLFFTIYKFQPSRKRGPSTSLLAARFEERDRSQLAESPPNAEAATGRPSPTPAASLDDAAADSAQEEPLNMSKKRKLDAALLVSGSASAECWVPQGGALPMQLLRPPLQRQPSCQWKAVGKQLPAAAPWASKSGTGVQDGVEEAEIGCPAATPSAVSVSVGSTQPASVPAKAKGEAAVVVGGVPPTDFGGCSMLTVLCDGSGNVSSQLIPEQCTAGSGSEVNRGAVPGFRDDERVDDGDESDATSALNLCVGKR